MPAHDFYHDKVKQALIKDGWIITDDPLDLSVDGVHLFADLGAERLLGAERGNEKIAVEIKSFMGSSFITEFHKALGQYENYRFSLEELEPDRSIWLAISETAWNDFFQTPFIQKVIRRYDMTIIVIDIETKSVLQWIK